MAATERGADAVRPGHLKRFHAKGGYLWQGVVSMYNARGRTEQQEQQQGVWTAYQRLWQHHDPLLDSLDTAAPLTRSPSNEFVFAMAMFLLPRLMIFQWRRL
jgi:hypothetical protein